MPSPNKIKYSTSLTSGTIKAGNFLIGINDDVTYGPTSVTGFYQSLTPVTSGFTVHQNKVTLGPSTFRPNNDSEFITLAKALGGNVTGVTESIVYLESQSDIVVLNRDYEDIVTSGLSICLDAGYTPSYPRSGTTFYNVANSNNALTFSLLNGVSYSSEVGGSLVFDGADDEVVSNDVYTMVSGMTWDIWVKRTSDGNIFNMMMSNFIPYMAFRGTGSGSDINRYQISYRTITGGTTSQRNLYTTGATFSNNIWYNFTYTLLYDLQNQLATAKIYVNGVFNTSSSNYTDSLYQPSVGSRLRLGNYTSNQYPFPGNIARFLVYDRALSDTEIQKNYQSQFPRFLNENIVTNGLVNYLDAGYVGSYPTTGTTWYDVSGYGRNGTLTNGPTYSTDGGGSIVFDGVDDYVTNIGTTSTFSFIQNTGIFTISAWVKLSDLSTARYFMGNNDGTAGSKGFFLGHSATSGRLWLSITYGTSGQFTLNQTKNNFFTDSNWVLVTCVGNGTNCQFYKNGISFDTPNNFGTFSTGDSSRVLGVGRVNNTSVSNYWSGNVALTQIYNRALSSVEVLQNYNAQKSRFGY